jgi:hypothetical protein
MQLDINHIDEQEFLSAYLTAHAEALNVNNVKVQFAGIGLVPYASD